MLFSEKFACIACGVSYPEITPRMFSFNNPHGACPNCDGIGAKLFFDPDLIVPNEELSLREGAIDPWEKRNAPFFQQILEAVADHYKIDMLRAVGQAAAPSSKKIIMEGSGSDEVDFFFEKGGTRHKFKKEFEGVLANLERRLHEYERRRREEGNRGGEDGFEAAYEEFHRYMNRSPCEECEGTRLRKEARFVKVGELPIHELTGLPIRDAHKFFSELELSQAREGRSPSASCARSPSG